MLKKINILGFIKMLQFTFGHEVINRFLKKWWAEIPTQSSMFLFLISGK